MKRTLFDGRDRLWNTLTGLVSGPRVAVIALAVGASCLASHGFAQTNDFLKNEIEQAFGVGADSTDCVVGRGSYGTFYGIPDSHPSFTVYERNQINQAIIDGLNSSPKNIHFIRGDAVGDLAPILSKDTGARQLSDLLKDQTQTDYVVRIVAKRLAPNIATVEFTMFERIHDENRYACPHSQTFVINVDSRADASEEASQSPMDKQYFIEVPGYREGLRKLENAFSESPSMPDDIAVHYRVPACALGSKMLEEFNTVWGDARLPKDRPVDEPKQKNMVLVKIELASLSDRVATMLIEYYNATGARESAGVARLLLNEARIEECRKEIEVAEKQGIRDEVEVLLKERHGGLLDELSTTRASFAALKNLNTELEERVEEAEKDRRYTEDRLAEAEAAATKLRNRNAELGEKLKAEEEARRSAEMTTQNLKDDAREILDGFIEKRRENGEDDIADHVTFARDAALRETLPVDVMRVFLEQVMQSVDLTEKEDVFLTGGTRNPREENKTSKTVGTGSCQETLTANIVGPVAKISVAGGCRPYDEVAFRFDPGVSLEYEPAADRVGDRFDLTLPVLQTDQSLKIQQRPGERQPDSLELQAKTDGKTYVVLEWREAVDLDLHVFEGRAAPGTQGHVTADRPGAGRIVLDQNASARQDPRFAIYEVDSAIASERRVEVLYNRGGGACDRATSFYVHVFRDGQRQKTSGRTNADCSGRPVAATLR